MLGYSALSELPLSAQPAAISGDVTVSGQTLTVVPTLVAGTVTASASVSGQTLSVTPTLVSGSVTGTAVVAGQVLSVTPTLVAGRVTTNNPVVDDYDSHWHYAREQKKRRAKQRSLEIERKREQDAPKPVVAPISVTAVQRFSTGLLSAASMSMAPIYSVDAGGAFGSAVPGRGAVLVLQVPSIEARGAFETSMLSQAKPRALKVMDAFDEMDIQLRDLEDMIDLYSLLMAA